MSVRMMKLQAASKRQRNAGAGRSKAPWTRAAMLAWAREAGAARAKADRAKPVSGWKLYRRTGQRPSDVKLARALDEWNLTAVALAECRRASFWAQVVADSDVLQDEVLEAFAEGYDRHVDGQLARGGSRG